MQLRYRVRAIESMRHVRRGLIDCFRQRSDDEGRGPGRSDQGSRRLATERPVPWGKARAVPASSGPSIHGSDQPNARRSVLV